MTDQTTPASYNLALTHSGIHAVRAALHLAITLAGDGDARSAHEALRTFRLLTYGRTAIIARVMRDLALIHLDAVAVDGHGDELLPEPVTFELIASLEESRARTIEQYSPEALDALELSDARLRSMMADRERDS